MKQRRDAWFAAADTNKDGEITYDEIEELRSERFEKFDANKDGVVTGEEVVRSPHFGHGLFI